MAAWRFTKARYEADQRGFERFDSMQLEYSLVDRHEEQNLLPVCPDQGVGTLAWSPLAGGFLAGLYDREDAPDDGSRAAEDPYMEQRFTEENWAVLDVVRDLADTKDATMAQVQPRVAPPQGVDRRADHRAHDHRGTRRQHRGARRLALRGRDRPPRSPPPGPSERSRGESPHPHCGSNGLPPEETIII